MPDFTFFLVVRLTLTMKYWGGEKKELSCPWFQECLEKCVAILYDSKSIHFFFSLQIVDTFFIGRYVLLAVVGTVFLVAFFMLLPLHFLEPVHAKALRTY
uniref:Uncharacterized protein n=1 Tax=Xiphophorus couchianus TaxID=32473 RepID=A0A3B5MJV7_9TELE